MTGSLPAFAQRSADIALLEQDRLTMAVENAIFGAPGVLVDRGAAETESAALHENALRGETGAWPVSRAIDLAAQWPMSEHLQLCAAHLIALTSDTETASLCWRGVLQRFPESVSAARHYATSHESRLGSSMADEIFTAYQLGLSRSENGVKANESFAALEHAFEFARNLRGKHSRTISPTQDPVILIGGTLGSGGAERQLVNSAVGIQQRHESGETAIGPVKVYCRKLDSRRGNDFHLSALERADIPVIDYLRTEAYGGNKAASRLAPLAASIEKLPHRMREGVLHLTELLRFEAPQVVQIWQDGAIFAAGLAALLANVPRIILTVRTMPPNARTDRFKPEQLPLYRGLLAAERVSLTANSLAAARAYEDWLDLPANSVRTVANGVEPLSPVGSNEEQNRWDAFDARTGGGFTLGGLMRLDDNKRPLEWLAIAASLASRTPNTRFILVGTGPLRNAAEDYARRAGIADRTLFVGRTANPGFWLERMDALALTSRHEGMPNALIEAQLAGLPVVTTSAGGAPEAVARSKANCILEDVLTIAIDKASAHLAKLAERPRASVRQDSEYISQWAEETFSTDQMVMRTLDIFAAD